MTVWKSKSKLSLNRLNILPQKPQSMPKTGPDDLMMSTISQLKDELRLHTGWGI